MNAAIAELLKARLDDLLFLQDPTISNKVGGLVRPIPRNMEGKTKIFPVACNVEDPLACDDSTIRELVPDGRYAVIIYFEDKGIPKKETSRTRGTSYRSIMRMVVWMDTSKLGPTCTTGDIIQREINEAIEGGGRRYDLSPFMHVRHRVIGNAPKDPAIFSKYTYAEAERQFLNWPFDYFAIDIETEFRIFPGCEDQLIPSGADCWAPPSSGRRLYPDQFTCEQLQDPEHGLTPEQLGVDCLDCTGGATLCDLVATSTWPEIKLCMDGAQVDDATADLCVGGGGVGWFHLHAIGLP